jgi:hypothetical protein
MKPKKGAHSDLIDCEHRKDTRASDMAAGREPVEDGPRPHT